MRLVALKLKNYRAYQEEALINLTHPMVLIGKNDAGKSTILHALDHFFNGTKPDADDCSTGSNSNLVRIGCVFDQLPVSLVLDEQHHTSFEDERLVNADGHLEVIKEFKVTTKGTVATMLRCNHPNAANVGDLLQLTNQKLKTRAQQVGADLSQVNQSVNPQLRAAIRRAVGNLALTDKQLELPEAMAKMVEKQFPVFAYFRSDRESTDQDDEAQDPMKAAVRLAIKTQEEELRRVTDSVKAKVEEIAKETVKKLKEMAPGIADELKTRVENKPWDGLFSVRLTDEADVSINKRGSGTKRLVLLNFFRAEAERAAEGKEASVIYGIEEPETSQHPNNQAMLVQAFQELASRPGCQVILTTHNPNLARRFAAEHLHLVKMDTPAPTLTRGDTANCTEEIARTLGVHADHNIKVFVGVEGPTDIDFWKSLATALRAAGATVPDVGSAESSGTLLFVPLGGSNLAVWASRLAALGRPEIYIMDRDVPAPAPPKQAHVDFVQAVQNRANVHATILSRLEIENYIHQSLILHDHARYAGTGAPFEDVPNLFAQAVHEEAQGANPWAQVDEKKRNQKESRAKKKLCTEYASKMTPQLLQQVDNQGEIMNLFGRIDAALRA